MKAIVMHERGGAEVLRYETVPTPKPLEKEVLIKVEAATVNHTDIFHRTGQFFIQKSLPHILGMDVAGEIVELGAGVTNWQIGDRVVATFEDLGRKRDGAYAEYTTLPIDQLHRIPDNLSYVDAASIGLAFTTAWIALFNRGRLQQSDTVAIHAASSGVGTSAIQIAQWQGARTIAISSLDKSDRLYQMGADLVIDRHSPKIVSQVIAGTQERGATLVLDLVGRTTLQSSIQMLSRNGRIICAGTLSGDLAEIDVMDLIMKNGCIKGCFDTVTSADYQQILQLFADGTFQPAIDLILPLSEARIAHERIEAKQGFGKIVLVPLSASNE